MLINLCVPGIRDTVEVSLKNNVLSGYLDVIVIASMDIIFVLCQYLLSNFGLVLAVLRGLCRYNFVSVPTPAELILSVYSVPSVGLRYGSQLRITHCVRH